MTTGLLWLAMCCLKLPGCLNVRLQSWQMYDLQGSPLSTRSAKADCRTLLRWLPSMLLDMLRCSRSCFNRCCLKLPGWLYVLWQM